MMKKMFLIGICLVFLSLIIVFAFMKNGDEKMTVEAKNKTPIKTTVENKTNRRRLCRK